MTPTATLPAPKPFLTPGEASQEIDIRVQSILAWIASGELAASDVSTKRGAKRPTWRIARSDLELFLASRRAVQAPPPLKRQRQREPAEVQYFPEQ